MIPLSPDRSDPGVERLANRLQPCLPQEDRHLALALAEAAAGAIALGGPLWTDPVLEDFALARALWTIGEDQSALDLLRSGPAGVLGDDLLRRLCEARAFCPSAVLMARAGILRVEAWPSAGGREVVRVRLDEATALDCLQSELVMRQTLAPILTSAAGLVPPEGRGVIALDVPAAARAGREAFSRAGRELVHAGDAGREFWCLS